MKRLNRIYFKRNMSEKEDMPVDAQGANIGALHKIPVPLLQA